MLAGTHKVCDEQRSNHERRSQKSVQRYYPWFSPAKAEENNDGDPKRPGIRIWTQGNHQYRENGDNGS